MEFRLLGPLEVVDEGEAIALGGRRQRVVLVRLLLRAGETVPTTTLIDDVWGDDPPEAVRNSLQSYVSHLRKALGAHRIESGAGGYLLRTDAEEIDIRRFEAMVTAAVDVAPEDPSAAAADLRRALELWRGAALADLVDEPSLSGEVARLEELRLRATEHLYRAEVAAGRHSAVIGDLDALTRQHEFRERLWAQLMLALYRSGRQGEALAAYERARAGLRRELGIDPSPELESLYVQILRQVPELDAPERSVASLGRAAELVPNSRFGGYRIERTLGRGGMGVVYLAEHLGLGRRVALKVIRSWLVDDPAFVTRFVRESRVVASLDHPNVIPVYEAGDQDGQPYIAMRFVDGRDLRRVIDEDGPLEAVRVAAIIGQVAGALDAAYALGLVHRDVKPANVLLSGPLPGPVAEHAYLGDFGLARSIRDVESSSGGSQLVGTLDYTPPEAFRGEPLDGRADQYALAGVAFECLTGSPPFPRPDAAAQMRAHLDEPPPTVTAVRPDLPRGLDAVLARALAKAPGDRFGDCGDFARALQVAIAADDEADGTSPERPPHRARPRGLMAAAVLAALVAVVGAVVVRHDDGDEAASGAPTMDDGAASTLVDLPAGMAILDAASGEETAFIPTSAVAAPVEASYADGSFWVLNLEPLSFVQIDAGTGEVVRQIASPVDDVGGYVVDGNALWVSHYTEPVVAEVDIERGLEVQRFDLPLPGGNGGVLVADGSLWVARRDAYDGLGAVLRLDPATGRVQHEFPRLIGSYALAYGDDGAVWTAGTFGAINRVDPATNTVVSGDVRGRNFYVAVGGGFAWTTDEAEGVVHKVDAAGTVVDTVPTGSGARSLAFSDGVVWIGNQDAGTVTALDTADGTTSSYLFGHPLDAVAAGDGRVLVQLHDGAPVEDQVAGLDGEVAEVLIGSYALEPLDPALASSGLGHQVFDATCAGLVRRADDTDEVMPEVAAARPTVSADGRTFSFRIRTGFGFSPPSGEAVTAETMRSTIERALSPALPDAAPGPTALPDLEGVAAYRSGTADRISGLAVDGDELRITLVARSADFLERLAATTFCAVPAGTPIDHRGGAAITTEDGPPELTVPAAGPYYIARSVAGEVTILLVNPDYEGSRPHRFDAIVLREGIAPSQASGLVDAGELDGIIGVEDVDEVLGARLGCRMRLGDGLLDLAALCPVDA